MRRERGNPPPIMIGLITCKILTNFLLDPKVENYYDPKKWFIKLGSIKFESRADSIIEGIGFVYGNVAGVQHGGTGGSVFSCNWESNDKVLTVQVINIIA